MFTEMQKAIMKKIRTRVIVCGVALIILLVLFSSSFINLILGPADLYSLSLDELEGAYVEADVGVIIDVFAEYTEKEKSGRETTIKEYYVVPVGDAEFFGMGFKQNELRTAQKISAETFEYIIGERSELKSTVHVKGTIKKMNDELSQYYYEWFLESGFIEYSSLEEIEQYALALVLEPSDIGLFEDSIVYLALAACAILLICILIFVLQGVTGSGLSRVKKFIRENEGTDSLETIEADYHNAAAIEKVRIGTHYTFYYKGINANIIRNYDVIWAYLKRITHRTNGIKTHVTKLLILQTRSKIIHNIEMRTEEGIGVALNLYSQNNPHIILGYSEDLNKCFRKDFNAFVNMSDQQYEAYANSAAAAANTAAANSSTAAADSAGSTAPGQYDGAAQYDNMAQYNNTPQYNDAAQYNTPADGQDGAVGSVILRSSGANSIMVIKTVREILECGLKEAKDIVDNVPSVMLENIPLNDALAIKAALESHGATVDVE